MTEILKKKSLKYCIAVSFHSITGEMLIKFCSFCFNYCFTCGLRFFIQRSLFWIFFKPKKTENVILDFFSDFCVLGCASLNSTVVLYSLLISSIKEKTILQNQGPKLLNKISLFHICIIILYLESILIPCFKFPTNQTTPNYIPAFAY